MNYCITVFARCSTMLLLLLLKHAEIPRCLNLCDENENKDLLDEIEAHNFNGFEKLKYR